jgi:hypothetical protein
MTDHVDIAEWLFVRRARDLPSKALADIFDRLVWIVDDNGGEICATLERWLKSSDRDRVEVALQVDGVFPFRDAHEMEAVLSRVASTWPDFAERCRKIMDTRRKQNPTEYRSEPRQ